MSVNNCLTRGQHHLPQFLLKGFASRARKKEVFTWLIRKGLASVEANVKGIAKIRDFYGAPGESDLEQKYAEVETGFAKLVKSLRDGYKSDDKLLVCQFIANTQVRTANLRAGVAETMNVFFGEFTNALTAESNRAKLSDNAYARVMNHINDGELDHILKNFSTKQQRAMIASVQPRLRRFLDSKVKEMTGALAEQIPTLADPTAFKESQNKLLAEHIAPAARVEQLMKLDWNVHHCQADTLILGDVGTIAGTEQGELINVLTHDPLLHTIYLPISSDRLLAGTIPGAGIASIAALNLASAELSREFVVDSKPDAHLDLHSRIGDRATLLSEEEVSTIVDSAFDKL